MFFPPGPTSIQTRWLLMSLQWQISPQDPFTGPEVFLWTGPDQQLLRTWSSAKEPADNVHRIRERSILFTVMLLALGISQGCLRGTSNSTPRKSNSPRAPILYHLLFSTVTQLPGLCAAQPHGTFHSPSVLPVLCSHLRPWYMLLLLLGMFLLLPFT